jgi:Leucine-rich repeat (LRR) protein
LFHDLVSLKEITLADNSIEDIASNVFSGHGLDNLESINLDCNNLTHLNDIFIGLTKLKRVSVAYNQLTTINNKTFNGLINLTQINLDSNRLKCLKSDLFSGLVRLKEIHLYNNQLEFIQGTQFNGLINLECIDLDGNKLHNLVASLFKGNPFYLFLLYLFLLNLMINTSVRKYTIKFRFGSDFFQSESFLISNSYVSKLNE